MKLGDTFAGRLPKPAQPTQPALWPCPHCGQEAIIDDVFPSLDGERTLTMWSCEPCRVVAVTPNAFIFPSPKKCTKNENHENGVPDALNPPNPPLLGLVRGENRPEDAPKEQ